MAGCAYAPELTRTRVTLSLFGTGTSMRASERACDLVGSCDSAAVSAADSRSDSRADRPRRYPACAQLRTCARATRRGCVRTCNGSHVRGTVCLAAVLALAVAIAFVSSVGSRASPQVRLGGVVRPARLGLHEKGTRL